MSRARPGQFVSGMLQVNYIIQFIMYDTNPFSSFWIAGYECTDKINAFGNRVDFLSLTGHIDKISEDYKALKPFNIRTVREGIRWSQVEKQPFVYDWTTVMRMLLEGRAHGIQQVWDLCHFGYPDDLTPLHPMFARRFEALCRAFVRFYRRLQPHQLLIVTPINEVSFISWLGGDVKGTVPFCTRQGWEVKYALMKAYIEGAKAMREEDPSVRFLSTEPLVNIVAPLNATLEEYENAGKAHNDQYQALDILCGKLCPELGGRPDLLDVIGVNFYYNNQWEIGYQVNLPWRNDIPDQRWRPLRLLLHETFLRYQRPLVLAETSHPGIERPEWMNFIATECAAAMQMDIPLWGVCLYPIIDRPDWDHLHLPWHNSGLWDIVPQTGNPLKRVLCEAYADALLQAQSLLDANFKQKNI